MSLVATTLDVGGPVPDRGPSMVELDTRVTDAVAPDASGVDIGDGVADAAETFEMVMLVNVLGDSDGKGEGGREGEDEDAGVSDVATVGRGTMVVFVLGAMAVTKQVISAPVRSTEQRLTGINAVIAVLRELRVI